MAFARDFTNAGAAALSILTEPVFFHGDPAYIPAIRPYVDIPLLRKDFIIDERQLAESRALGADAVLLIAGVLGNRLGDMVDSALAYGLEPLVEVHCHGGSKRSSLDWHTHCRNQQPGSPDHEDRSLHHHEAGPRPPPGRPDRCIGKRSDLAV